MRIALIAHVFGFGDGQGRVNYETARAALDDGFSVTLIAEKCAEDIARHPNAQLVILPTSRLPTRFLKNISFAVRSAFWLMRHGKDIVVRQANGFTTFARTDIVVAHFVHGAWMRSPFASLKGKRLSASAVYQYIYSRLNSYLEQLTFIGASKVVAISEKVEQELISVGVSKSRISVIYNGVDLEEFRPRRTLRSSFSLPENVVIFLFSGDIRTPRKNLDGVLRAIAQVKEVHLAVAGRAESSPFLSLAKSLNIIDRVHFLGYISDMSSLMGAVDAFVFPSRYDPMGLVVLEAMASGLPVITSKATGASALLGDTALTLQDPEDLSTLVQLIRTVADDADLRKRVGDANRQLVTGYSWASMASLYVSLYREQVRRKDKPA